MLGHHVHRSSRALAAGTLSAAMVIMGFAAPVIADSAHAAAAPSAATSAPTTAGVAEYLPSTVQLATIANAAGCTGTTTSCAPWNESQGTSSSIPYPETKLLPTYTPNGPTTPTGEPNVAVYPSATSGTTTVAPYPSGVVGTPGPLDDYCGPGSNAVEGAKGAKVSRQPAGTTLPFAPAYFPHVVKNATGGLTGYFDYRPKDADEALVAATATATGKHWTYAGEALEQNPGYCPTGDVNDDGEGHANLVSIDGKTYLYTLPRAAGDMQGVGLVVHQLSPSRATPLAGLPREESVGIDPDAFATAAATIPTSGSASLPVTSTGTARSPEQLVTGSFVDLTAHPTGTRTYVFSCTVALDSPTLTGCTAAKKAVSVTRGDLIEQVIGFTSAKKTVTIPAGPNKTVGTGGLKKLTIYATAKGSTAGFTNRLTGTTLNNNAPNRVYVNGTAVYCSQANTNPTTKIEGCTTGPDGKAVTVPAGSPVLSDPIIPATAYQAATDDAMTSGLVAPDGIVGVLPTFPGAKPGATIVMYTEKELSYYVAGVTPKVTVDTTTETVFGATITFTPGPYESSDMPASVSTATPVTVSMGDMTTKQIIPVTCTGLAVSASTGTLSGCTVPSADTGNKYTSSSWIGAPGATTVPFSTLKLTGEGKTTPKKLDKNNEDLTELRVAYTTTGVVFETTGLENGGVISGKRTAQHGSTYSDINDPSATANPTDATGAIDLNEYATPGTPDATEMRWVGSAGSIVTEPGGTIGLFLSGSWAADGDSDAFNQIFYSQSTNGLTWTVPRTILSTDYTFSASQREDTPRSPTDGKPLAVSAYYEGRAYGPSVVQDATGALTMVFAGYRVPKTIETVGSTLGTGYTTAPTWTITKSDPLLYRNILTAKLRLATQTSAVTATPATPTAGQAVTLSATVQVADGLAGTPLGQVSFEDTADTVVCTGSLVTQTGTDVASCTAAFTAGGSYQLRATYAGSGGDAASSSTAASTITVHDATATVVGGAAPSETQAGQPVELTATVSVTPPATATPAGEVQFSDATGTLCSSTLVAATTAGSATASCDASFQKTGPEMVQAAYGGTGDFLPSLSTNSTTVEVVAAPVITSATQTTFRVASAGSFDVTVATGTYPAPSYSLSGTGAGLGWLSIGKSSGVLAGTPPAGATGVFHFTVEATNGVSPPAVQPFTLTVDAGPAFTSPATAYFTIGKTGSFTVETSGYPPATITESGALPGQLTFHTDHNGTATISGTPGLLSLGSHEVTLSATDGIGSPATQRLTIVVGVPPTFLSAPTATFTAGVEGRAVVATVSYPAATVTESGALPTGVTFTAGPLGTALLSGAPARGTGGRYTFELTAANGVGTTVQTFVLVVVQPPAFTSSSSVTFVRGEPATFTVTTTGYPVPSITEAGPLPRGVTFATNHDGGGALVWHGTGSEEGTFHVTLRASNGLGPAATQVLTLKVT